MQGVRELPGRWGRRPWNGAGRLYFCLSKHRWGWAMDCRRCPGPCCYQPRPASRKRRPTFIWILCECRIPTANLHALQEVSDLDDRRMFLAREPRAPLLEDLTLFFAGDVAGVNATSLHSFLHTLFHSLVHDLQIRPNCFRPKNMKKSTIDGG